MKAFLHYILLSGSHFIRETLLQRGIVLKIYLFLNPVPFFSLCLLSLSQTSKGKRSFNASKQKRSTIIHKVDTQK